jgi:hypothetical protein
MLNTRLFAHLKPKPKQPHMDKVRIRKIDRRILATIVHELFHDFWHNVLDGRKRYLFAGEAEIFFIQTPLHLASFCGDEELAELLIDDGATVGHRIEGRARKHSP